MDLKIEINLDNAAFEDSGVHEIERILTEATQKLFVIRETSMPLRDLNGNRVGQLTITA